MALITPIHFVIKLIVIKEHVDYSGKYELEIWLWSYSPINNCSDDVPYNHPTPLQSTTTTIKLHILQDLNYLKITVSTFLDSVLCYLYLIRGKDLWPTTIAVLAERELD